jgi:voltage-gated potassium channel
MTSDRPENEQVLESERNEVLRQLEEWLEMPMLLLGLGWLVLVVLEFTVGLSPLLERVNTVIWVIFVLDFALRFTLAPRKGEYLKSNWLTALSLFLPALRLLRIARLVRLLRVARVARGLRLVRVVGSLNRGMRALGRSMGRRGFGYVLALTLLVTVVGAAGMFAFENEVPGEGGLHTYGNALWWTAMLMTTMGSDYWPQTPEGRILALILAIYAFAVFGYVTATLASFFIGRDAESEGASCRALRLSIPCKQRSRPCAPRSGICGSGARGRRAHSRTSRASSATARHGFDSSKGALVS